MMNLRPGGPSRHEMADNAAAMGYGAMVPGNQGMGNRDDMGLASKVEAENQALAQQNYKQQVAMKNAEAALPAQQIAMQDAMREQSLAETNKQAKIQTGLNSLMANIIENKVPSGGKYLNELHATTTDPIAGPGFMNSLRKGQALGVPKA